MKLSEKYELADLLTSGRVSTFLARDRTTQEQVLVHTFEGDGSSEGAASILARFSSLAPNPPGLVMQAGIDDLSSSAFLVTKMPEQAVLREWLRAYRSFTPAAGAAPASQSRPRSQPPDFGPPAGGIEPVARPNANPTPKQSPGEFTMLFRELGSFPTGAGQAPRGNTSPGVPSGPIMVPPDAGPQSGGGSKPEGEPGEITRLFSAAKKRAQMGTLGSATDAGTPDTKEPGEFTRQFKAVSEQFTRPVPAAPPTPAPVPPVAKSPAQSSPFSTDIFGPGAPPASPQTSFGQGTSDAKSSGDFTNFFGGPFGQPSAPSKPIVVPDEPPVRPAREQVGDFTRVFGKGAGDTAETPTPATPPPEPPKPAGSFTQFFGRDAMKPPAPTPEAHDSGPVAVSAPMPTPVVAAPVVQPPKMPVPVPPPMPTPQFPTPVVPPIIPPVVPVESAAPVAAPDVAPAQPAARAQSEFTMFITRKDLDAALAPEPVDDSGGQAAAAAPPSFTLPAAPPLPKPKMPAAPKAPPPPKLPKLEAPKPPAGAAPPATLWPLITVFTVLLAIAAILVMYFLLRH